MFYQSCNTPFIDWAISHNVKDTADGLGMLVGQAAHAFALWHETMPDIEPVIKQLRSELSA